MQIPYRVLLILMCFTATATAQVKKEQSSGSKTKFFQSAPAVSKVTVPAQDKCYTVAYEEKLKEKYANRLATESFEKLFSKHLDTYQTKRTTATEEIYRIPTIVHIIHNGEAVGTGVNITAEQVYSQFDVLNEDFRRLGAGYNEHPDGADILVEFYPVTLDPDGNVLEEEGIDRVNGGRSSWPESPIEDELKPETIWDPLSYFNMWVVVFGGELANRGVLGYAQFPSLSGLEGLNQNGGEAETDGIIMEYTVFGSTGNVVAPYDQGRTVTHEVGHWLGLRHIWGDDDCNVDDYCMDTPNAGQPNYICSTVDSCPDDEGSDMIENYMDYTNDACMNIFTQDQKARIRTTLEVSPRRKSLISPSCSEAEEVIVGNHTTTAPMWYTYTAETQEIVTVSSIGETEINTLLRLHSSCETSPINTSDDALGTAQSELSTLLEAGESLTIYWGLLVSPPTEFSWNLSTTNSTDAMVCELANEAVEGENTLPATELNTYWYSYTITETNPKVTINGNGHPYTVYTNTCDQLIAVASGTTEELIVDIESEQLFVAFEAGEGGFPWTLTEEALSPGEACSVAISAIEGTNTAPSAPYWYTFTMPEDGTLVVSSSGLTEVETHASVYNACGGDLIAENKDDGSGQTEISLRLAEGDEVAIVWDSIHSEDGFDWSLSVEPITNGESCYVPAIAESGINTAPGAPIWYSYTMVADGGLLISSEDLTTQDTYLYILDECDGTILVADDDINFEEGILQSEGYVGNLEAGQTLMIYWGDDWITNAAPFDWELSEVESIQGDACAHPVEAVLGTNTVAAVLGDYFWTTYVIPESDRKFIISATANEYGFFVTDCEDLNVLSYGYGSASLVGALAGDEILIAWTLENGEGFEWTLSVENLEPGDLCNDPLEAKIGINSARYAPFWYTYTMPKAGNIRISSMDLTTEDTYLYILDECDADPLYEIDDIDDILQSELLIEDVAADETILIYWSNEYSAIALDWSLTLEGVVNIAPTISDQSFVLNRPSDNIATIGTVTASDADGDALSFTITEGNDSEAFAIDKATGELTLDLSLWDSSADVELTVEVTDRIETDEATISLEIIILGTDPLSEIQISPNPATDKFYIDVKERRHVMKATLVDLAGKVVRTVEEETEISTKGLTPGVYLLKIQLDTEYQIHKVIIEQ